MDVDEALEARPAPVFGCLRANEAATPLLPRPSAALHVQWCKQELQWRKSVYSLTDAFRTQAAHREERLAIKSPITGTIGKIAASRSRVRIAQASLERLLETRVDAEVPSTYSCLCVCERFADQAEVQVLAKPSFAWPLGLVAAHVCDRFADVERAFDAVFLYKCPHVQGLYRGGDLDGAFEEPQEEDELGYHKRSCALVRVWLCTQLCRAKPDFAQLWRWLAGVLNEPPRRVSASLLLTALETMAQGASQGLMAKLVAYAEAHYLPKVRELHLADPRLLDAELALLELWVQGFRDGSLPARPEMPEEETGLFEDA